MCLPHDATSVTMLHTTQLDERGIFSTVTTHSSQIPFSVWIPSSPLSPQHVAASASLSGSRRCRFWSFHAPKHQLIKCRHRLCTLQVLHNLLPSRLHCSTSNLRWSSVPRVAVHSPPLATKRRSSSSVSRQSRAKGGIHRAKTACAWTPSQCEVDAIAMRRCTREEAGGKREGSRFRDRWSVTTLAPFLLNKKKPSSPSARIRGAQKKKR